MYNQEAGENFPFPYNYNKELRELINETTEIHYAYIKRSADLPSEGIPTKPNPKIDAQQLENIISEIKKSNSATNLNVDKVSVESIVEMFQKSCINPDILIKIGNANIYGHRNLLKKFTDFFERTGVCAEMYSVRLPEDKVSPKTFDLIYTWMLMSQKEPAQFMNRRNLMGVYNGAQYLNIPDLENFCKNAMSDEFLFKEETAFYLYLDAFHFKNKKAMEIMLPRIQKFFLPLVSKEIYFHLPFHVVVNLLSSNYICVHNELEVFMAGVRWLHGDWETRSSLAAQVMKCVRYGLMSPTQLVDIKRNPDSPEILEVTNIKDVSKLIDDGMAYAVQIQCFEGDMSQIAKACKTMNLEPPDMRNWINEQKVYQSYKHFLEELSHLKEEGE